MDRQNWFAILKNRITPLMTKKNQCILFVFTIVVAAASIYTAVTDFFPQPVSITLYVLAAFGFSCSCTLWVRAIIFFVKLVLVPFTQSNKIANMLIKDARLRTVLTTLPGMGLNLIYAVFNGIVGIVNHSAWCGSLSAYYILLCVMRLLSVSYAGKIYSEKRKWKKLQSNQKDEQKKDNSIKMYTLRSWRVYHNCGIMLSVTSIALGGAVIMLVSGEGGKTYPGIMIYAVATYTFYKMVMAVRNMIMARKGDSALLSTLRNISYADALVSMLSLQTALFAAFGQDSEEMIPLMNALTGAAVCLMIFALGIIMVHKSKLKKEEDYYDIYTSSRR